MAAMKGPYRDICCFDVSSWCLYASHPWATSILFTGTLNPHNRFVGLITFSAANLLIVLSTTTVNDLQYGALLRMYLRYQEKMVLKGMTKCMNSKNVDILKTIVENFVSKALIRLRYISRTSCTYKSCMNVLFCLITYVRKHSQAFAVLRIRHNVCKFYKERSVLCYVLSVASYVFNK